MVRVWEAESGRLVRTLPGHTSWVVTCQEGCLRADRLTRRCGCGRSRAAGWCGRWPGTSGLSTRWRACRGGCWRAGWQTGRLRSGASLTLSVNKLHANALQCQRSLTWVWPLCLANLSTRERYPIRPSPCHAAQKARDTWWVRHMSQKVLNNHVLVPWSDKKQQVNRGRRSSSTARKGRPS